MIRIAIGFVLTAVGLTAALAGLGLWPSILGGALAGLGLILAPSQDQVRVREPDWDAVDRERRRYRSRNRF